MIKINNIHKSYGNLEVLKGINLEVNNSEIVSILGSSGAGKTTLLQIIGTLLKPDSGNIIINGVDTNTLDERSLAKFRNKHIGFVFQFHHLLPEFTALENVCIPGFIAKRNKYEVKKTANQLLKSLNIYDRANHKPNELSGGERQRVAIARALINNPSIILADEPSGNLDSVNAKALYDIIFDLRKDFMQTFIIVTHNQEHAKLTDKLFTIADGIIE